MVQYLGKLHESIFLLSQPWNKNRKIKEERGGKKRKSDDPYQVAASKV
jgi:hypothetical protein